MKGQSSTSHQNKFLDDHKQIMIHNKQRQHVRYFIHMTKMKS